VPFQLGQRSGDYEFIDIMDSSRAGVAYKVRNLRQGRFELLRVLATAAQEDQERTNRFLREAAVHARLAHANIVTFYDALVLDGQFVITTELLEGVRLSERLELGPLPMAEAVDMVRQALAALSCAKEHGVVHRELTPANLAVTPDGVVKLAGFNLAKAREDPTLTQAGAALGDVAYMSPEQVKAIGPLDHRSDLYSVGVVLYEAVTGKRPFDSKSQFDVMLAHVNQTPKLPSRLDPSLPAEFDRIVLKALAKEPEDRFQNADEFRQALETLSCRTGLQPVQETALEPVVQPVQAQVEGLCHVVPAAPVSVRPGPVLPPSNQWGFPQFALLVLATFAVVTALLLLVQHA
jgi:eukaryotic-like serine/threonine-protein kinase